MINENSPVGKAATAGDIVAGGIVATTGIAVASQHQSDPGTVNPFAAEPIQLKMPSEQMLRTMGPISPFLVVSTVTILLN